jgi:hypothetical protein
MASMSGTSSTIRGPSGRPDWGVEPPYPGRDHVTIRRSSLVARSSSRGKATAAEGVPVTHTHGNPSEFPAVRTSKLRPSGVVTVLSELGIPPSCRDRAAAVSV